MSREKNFDTYLKEKYANEEKEQNTATDSPNFRVGFLEFLQKDKHEEDNSSQKLDNFIAAERSSNTVKKTKYEWKKFQAFCEQQVNGNFNVMNIPAATLNKLLGKFFKDIRKQNGSEYEPDSISSFPKSIQRHLKELKLLFNILQDEEFCCSREVLAAKRKNLLKQGRGNKPNACRELTTEEDEKLFESGEFGCQNREAL